MENPVSAAMVVARSGTGFQKLPPKIDHLKNFRIATPRIRNSVHNFKRGFRQIFAKRGDQGAFHGGGFYEYPFGSGDFHQLCP
jgi:hypothetical protein